MNKNFLNRCNNVNDFMTLNAIFYDSFVILLSLIVIAQCFTSTNDNSIIDKMNLVIMTQLQSHLLIINQAATVLDDRMRQ